MPITRRYWLSLPLGLPYTWGGLATASSDARITAALADMRSDHEVVPLGVANNIGWKRRPDIGANTEPYGAAIPKYWKGKRYVEWRAMLPWFVIYEGEPSNPAENVQVEVSGIECWVLLQSTREWVLAGAAERPAWDSIYAPNAIDRLAANASGRGSDSSVRYTPRPGAMVHGGLSQLPVPWRDGSADIRALYVSARHRLVLKESDKADDRSKANIGLQVGLDYYPWLGAKLADLGAAYVPGAGLGRFLRVAADWRFSSLILRKDGVSDGELATLAPPVFKY